MIELKKKFENFSVFCAFENQALDALNLGVDGFINATSNFAPEFTVNTLKYFKEENDKLTRENFLKMKDAMKIYEYSKPLFLACKQAVYDRVINKDRFEKLPHVFEQPLTMSIANRSIINVRLFSALALFAFAFNTSR
jgi:4-hydroxy-tetrahydrodipicolinate synthase